jgi:hypothetical protein
MQTVHTIAELRAHVSGLAASRGAGCFSANHGQLASGPYPSGRSAPVRKRRALSPASSSIHCQFGPKEDFAGLSAHAGGRFPSVGSGRTWIYCIATLCCRNVYPRSLETMTQVTCSRAVGRFVWCQPTHSFSSGSTTVVEQALQHGAAGRRPVRREGLAAVGGDSPPGRRSRFPHRNHRCTRQCGKLMG